MSINAAPDINSGTRSASLTTFGHVSTNTAPTFNPSADLRASVDHTAGFASREIHDFGGLDPVMYGGIRDENSTPWHASGPPLTPPGLGIIPSMLSASHSASRVDPMPLRIIENYMKAQEQRLAQLEKKHEEEMTSLRQRVNEGHAAQAQLQHGASQHQTQGDDDRKPRNPPFEVSLLWA